MTIQFIYNTDLTNLHDGWGEGTFSFFADNKPIIHEVPIDAEVEWLEETKEQFDNYTQNRTNTFSIGIWGTGLEITHGENELLVTDEEENGISEIFRHEVSKAEFLQAISSMIAIDNTKT
jgi:hypothetical protein